MTLIGKRVVLHFPGFEPLDGKAHRARYERSAKQSAAVWNYEVQTGPAVESALPTSFEVETDGEGWRTKSRIHMLDHNALVRQLRSSSVVGQILAGFGSFVRIIFEGGSGGYFRHAWRFGLFFIFPFLLTMMAALLAIVIALQPLHHGLSILHYLWTLPLSAAFFAYVFLPFSERFHTLHLFADWKME